MLVMRCPICHESTNTSGNPIASEWAVTAHIAGKILHASRDRAHRSWAKQKVGPTTSRSLFGLAEEIAWAVRSELAEISSTDQQVTPLSLAHEAEVMLHGFLKARLISRLGSEGEDWFVNGVSLKIREECAARRERDPARSEPYAHMYLIDLQSILKDNWVMFESDHRKLGKLAGPKVTFWTN